MGRLPGHVANSDLIRLTREAAGLTQEQLSAAANISVAVISKAENRQRVDLETIGHIALKLGLPLREALEERPDIRPGDAAGDGKFEIPPELAAKISSAAKLLAAITQMAQTAVELPEGFEIRLFASREGCMEIEFAGKPEHLALLEEAYRAGAFAPLGVLRFGRIYTPAPLRSGEGVDRGPLHQPSQADISQVQSDAINKIKDFRAAAKTNLLLAIENNDKQLIDELSSIIDRLDSIFQSLAQDEWVNPFDEMAAILDAKTAFDNNRLMPSRFAKNVKPAE